MAETRRRRKSPGPRAAVLAALAQSDPRQRICDLEIALTPPGGGVLVAPAGASGTVLLIACYDRLFGSAGFGLVIESMPSHLARIREELVALGCVRHAKALAEILDSCPLDLRTCEPGESALLDFLEVHPGIDKHSLDLLRSPEDISSRLLGYAEAHAEELAQYAESLGTAE